MTHSQTTQCPLTLMPQPCTPSLSLSSLSPAPHCPSCLSWPHPQCLQSLISRNPSCLTFLPLKLITHPIVHSPAPYCIPSPTHSITPTHHSSAHAHPIAPPIHCKAPPTPHNSSHALYNPNGNLTPHNLIHLLHSPSPTPHCPAPASQELNSAHPATQLLCPPGAAFSRSRGLRGQGALLCLVSPNPCPKSRCSAC